MAGDFQKSHWHQLSPTMKKLWTLSFALKNFRDNYYALRLHEEAVFLLTASVLIASLFFHALLISYRFLSMILCGIFKRLTPVCTSFVGNIFIIFYELSVVSIAISNLLSYFILAQITE